MRPAAEIELGPLIVAVIIVLGAVVVGFVLGARALARRVARADTELSTAEPRDPYRDPPGAPGAAPSADLAPLYYVVSILFWPAGFVLGGYLLKSAPTARIGRTCMLIAMSALACRGDERAWRGAGRMPS